MEGTEGLPRRHRALVVIAISATVVLGVALGNLTHPRGHSQAGLSSAQPPNGQARRPAYVAHLQFASATSGWAQVSTGGPYTALYRTQDAGLTWVESIRRTPGDFSWVRFFNSSEGVAAEAAGNLSFTSDGGVNWTLQGELPRAAGGAYCTPYFTSTRIGWCFQAPTTAHPAVDLFKTSDGGASWDTAGPRLAEPTADVSGARFTDGGVGLQAAWIPVLVSGGAPAIVYSPDAGDSWSKHSFTTPLPAVTRGGILTGAGAGQKLVVITEWQVTQADTNAILYAHRSDDGGRSWQEPVALPVIPFGILPVAIASLTRWTILDGRNLWSTRDGGKSWISVPSSLNTEVRVGALDEAVDGTLWLLDLGRPGTSPGLLRSINGGYHWDAVPVPP